MASQSVEPPANSNGTLLRWRSDFAATYWITAATASDARLLARSLPQNAVWAAHLRGRSCAAASAKRIRDVQMLREAGCGGLAVAWSEEVEAALDDGWYDAVSQTEKQQR